MQGHPKAKTLRASPLVFPDLCTSLFEGAAATGDLQWTPSSNYPRPRDSSPSFPSQTIQLYEDEDISHRFQQGGNQNPSTPGSQSNPGSQSGTFVPPNARPKKRSKTSMTVTQLEEDMSNALKCIIKNHDGPSYDECVEKLNEVGWEKSNPFYVAALGIFCEAPSYRKGWMSLPLAEIELIHAWITSVGEKLGYHV